MNKAKSIEELRKVCQMPKSGYDSPYKRRLLRPISIYFTRFFISHGVSANHITVASIVLVLASFIPFLWVSQWYLVVLSAVLLNIAYLLDTIDGELARYRGGTYYGRLLDVAGHDLFYVVFLFLGFGVYSATGRVIFLVMGVSAILFKTLLRLHEMRFEYMNLLSRSPKRRKCGRASKVFYEIGLAQWFLPFLYVTALVAQFWIVPVQALLVFYALYMPIHWLIWLAGKRNWKAREGKGESEAELWKRLRG